MSNNCFSSLQLAGIRATSINSGGAPVVGTLKAVATTAAIRLQVSTTLEAGSSYSQKKGNGTICTALQNPDTIKSLAFSMDLCQLDFELINLLTGAVLIMDTLDAIGFEYPASDAAPHDGVCLEAFTSAYDGTAPAVPTFTTPDAAYFHWVFPRTKWTLGQITMEDGLMTVPVTGVGTENANITANGPFNDWPAAVATHGGVTSFGGVFFDETLPTMQCGRITVPAQT